MEEQDTLINSQVEKLVEVPSFGDDFNTAFQTDLDFIDHTIIGAIVPLMPNEYLDTYHVDKPSKAIAGNMVYEVSGTRDIVVIVASEQEGVKE